MRDVKPFLNISSYKFVELSDTVALRESMRSRARSFALKGTILLAEEGVNIALAGQHEAVRAFVAELRDDARFADLEIKCSESDGVSFGRLLVKIKREIIRMNQPLVRPGWQRAPTVAPGTLARWLSAGHDEDGRDVVLLDARNAFEVDAGRFRDALDWRLAKFSDFPQALNAHRHELAGKTVVTYCTGGIRCEKAALWMLHIGVEHVRQLDGGILEYFGANGGAHFEGACFVFDRRQALDTALLPAQAV
jgi:UPF0176 protein